MKITPIKWITIMVMNAIILAVLYFATVYLFKLYDHLADAHNVGFSMATFFLAFILTVIGLAALVSMVLEASQIARNRPGSYFFCIIYSENSIVVDSMGLIIAILDENEFRWSWDKTYDSFSIYPQMEAKEVEVTIYSIEGRKLHAREVCCGIKIQPPSNFKGNQLLSDALGNKFPNYDDAVRSMLYDFCEEYSQDLSRLFNPYRQEQQEEYKNLLLPWIAPRLAAMGLIATDASFDFFITIETTTDK